jgi:hypothetical protein
VGKVKKNKSPKEKEKAFLKLLPDRVLIYPSDFIRG